ncbi:MAG: hypothetical protein ACR2MG_02420 [Pyrinomonadaceae bacterium]
MNYDTQASDWKVKDAGGISQAVGLAAGVWLFIFKSNTARCTSLLAFSGMGLGLGIEWKLIKGIETSISGPLFVEGEGTPIKCENSFSASEMNGKFGLVSSVGAAAGAGYGIVAITAFSLRKNYFKTQPIRGWNSGVGASAISSFGTWWHISNPRKLGIVVS